MKRYLSHVEFTNPQPLPAREHLAGSLDIHGIARRFGCGVRGATKWAKACPGIVYKSGNRVQVEAETLERWLEGDPEVRANAVRDYAAEARALASSESTRGVRLRAVSGGRR